jgi:hypothetical protein
MASPNVDCPGLLQKPLDAAIGQLFTPYCPGGREGDTQQNDDAKYTKFAGHFDGNHDAVVGYQAHRPIKNKRRSRAFLKATKRCRRAITSIVDIGSAKMAEFCALITKKTSPNQPIVKTFPKSTWCEDFGNALTFGQNGSYGCVLSAQKSVHNFA